MRNVLLPAVGALVIVTLALGGLAIVQAQPGPPMQTATLPGLEGIPPEQLFDHFMGAEIHMTDRDGNALTYRMTPGVVSSVDANSIVITPHGQTTTQTFNITPNTVVHAMPDRGSLQALAAGDHVVIITEGESADALVIFERGLGGRMGFGHPMFR